MKPCMLLAPLVGAPLLGALLLPVQPPGDAVKDELKKLEGTWSVVIEVVDGTEMPTERAKSIKVTFLADTTWQVAVDGKTVGEGTMTLDPSKKTIDYNITKGEDKGKKFLAIYELDGDSFKHCGSLKGDRPTEFASKAGSGHFLTMFRRDRKK